VGIAVGGIAAVGCGAISFVLLAAACGVAAGGAASVAGSELGDKIYGED